MISIENLPEGNPANHPSTRRDRGKTTAIAVQHSVEDFARDERRDRGRLAATAVCTLESSC